MPRILIVDDNATIQMELEEYLRHMNYDVVGVADNGHMAVKMARDMKPDLILMDVVMPGRFDGITAAQKIKEEMDAAVVFITGFGDPEYIERAKQVEPFGYVMKPFDEKEINGVIEIALHKRNLELELKKANRELKREIKERKRTEKALIESEAQKMAILDGITTNLAFVNEDLEFLWANKAAADSVCKTPDAMVGHKCYELWADPAKPCDGCPTVKAFKTKKTEQTIKHTPDGRVWEEKGEPVFDGKGGLIGVLQIAHDITARAQADEALRENEERFRTVADFTYDWEYWIAPSGHCIYVSPSCERISGYSPEAFMADPGLFKKIVHPEDHSIFIKHIQEEQNLEAAPNIDFRIITRSGRERWICHVCQPVWGNDGTFLGRRASNRDITDRKGAEDALWESERKYRELVENAVLGIYQVTKEGKFLMVNQRMANIFGYDSQQDFLANSDNIIKLYIDPTERPILLKEIDEKGHINGREVRFKRKEGTPIFCNAYTRQIKGKDGEYIYEGLLEDITERKNLEARLLKAHKMELVGNLSGGIAHDYNNLLAVIMGNLSLAREEAAPHSAMAERLHKAEQASLKARDLTRQFLTLSRGGHPAKNLGSIGNLLKEIPEQVQAHDGIEYVFSIQDNLWPVEYDPRQIENTITGLLMNAVEAMPRGGCITIRAENQAIKTKGRDASLPLKEGQYVRISIKDEGGGISEEHLDKIFDPYFSTKDRGPQKGMGMGLAVGQSVVQKHDGHIMINSTPGVGTVLTIYLPAAGEKGALETVKQEREDITPSTNSDQTTIKRILVMDDEEMLRDLAQMMLERLGHEVETVADGDEAIETYKKRMDSEEPFDAVVLDLTIKGGMGGAQTIKELIRIDPGVKGIVCSGYSNDPVITHYKKYGFQGAMPKPYQKADLEIVLKKVLG